MNRPHAVTVRLSDDEIARLDEMRPEGSSRAGYLRAMAQERPSADERPSHEESILILARMARDGKTQPAIALERALRDQDAAEPEGELARLLHDG